MLLRRQFSRPPSGGATPVASKVNPIMANRPTVQIMKKILSLIIVLACVAGYTRAEVPPAEKLLPDDTLVLLTAPNFQKIRDILKNSPQAQLWNDPTLKDFKDKFMTKLKSDYITPMEQNLGIQFSDYTGLPQGQVTFAVVQNGWENKDGQSASFLLLLDAKDKSAQLTSSLADLKKKWVDAGKSLRTEKIRNVDFSIISLTKADLPKSLQKKPAAPGDTEPMESSDAKKGFKQQLYIGQSDSLLIIGDSPKTIEKILIRLAGDSIKTVSDVPSFDANSAMFHNAQFFAWVNTKAFTDIVTQSTGADADDNGNPLALKPAKIVAAIGLNGLKSVAVSYTYTDAGFKGTVFLAVPEADRRGLFKILGGASKDCAPPAFVPADAVKFSRWRIDGQKTWENLRKMVSEISPAGVGVIDMTLSSAENAAKQKDPNFDFQKDLFGNLGDDFITYQKAPKESGLAGLSTAPSIFLFASPNPERLANALKNLLVLYSPQAGTSTDRDFLGHKIYSIPLPSAPGRRGAATPQNLSYTWSGGYIAVSTDPGILEEYLRSGENPGKSLKDTPGLSDAMAAVGNGSVFGYSNDNAQERILFDALKNDPSGDPLAIFTPIAAAMGMGNVNLKDWLDLSLLPPFDKISKYFYISVFSAGAGPDGLTLTGFAPVPPQLKQ
jgi:hypothetical protein